MWVFFPVLFFCIFLFVKMVYDSICWIEYQNWSILRAAREKSVQNPFDVKYSPSLLKSSAKKNGLAHSQSMFRKIIMDTSIIADRNWCDKLVRLRTLNVQREKCHWVTAGDVQTGEKKKELCAVSKNVFSTAMRCHYDFGFVQTILATLCYASRKLPNEITHQHTFVTTNEKPTHKLKKNKNQAAHTAQMQSSGYKTAQNDLNKWIEAPRTEIMLFSMV